MHVHENEHGVATAAHGQHLVRERAGSSAPAVGLFAPDMEVVSVFERIEDRPRFPVEKRHQQLALREKDTEARDEHQICGDSCTHQQRHFPTPLGALDIGRVRGTLVTDEGDCIEPFGGAKPRMALRQENKEAEGHRHRLPEVQEKVSHDGPRKFSEVNVHGI
jgi:hypothetical protein